ASAGVPSPTANRPNAAATISAATTAPTIWAAQYTAACRIGIRPATTKPRVIAGLKWAPEIAASAATITRIASPCANATATRLLGSDSPASVAALIASTPANTSVNVPIASARAIRVGDLTIGRAAPSRENRAARAAAVARRGARHVPRAALPPSPRPRPRRWLRPRGETTRRAAAHAPPYAAAVVADAAPCTRPRSASVRHVDVPRDHLPRAPHILDALVARLALDHEVHTQLRCTQHIEERGPVHLALPHGHLGAPFARPPGRDRILDVHLPHPRRQPAQRLHRVAHAVQDHVRRVEVHAHTGVAQVVQQLRQRVRRLLPGLQRHPHAPLREDARDLTDPIRQDATARVRGVVRDEPRMERDQRDAQHLREARAL